MKKIREGKIEVFVEEGEPTKKLPVFYNPKMEEHRNLTISVLNSYFKKKFLVCLPLAGSGVRGIRILKETKGDVVFNDITTEAVYLIEKNLKLNGLEAEVHKKDAKVFLFEDRFLYDYIDIDPFGSPVRFFEPAAWSLKKGSLFAATATDTGALSGSFKNACLRRYGVKVCKTEFFKELGIRVLITSIQRAFAKYDTTFHPLVSFSNHFFRVWGKAEKGKAGTDKNLEKIGFIYYCKKCLSREERLECCGKKKEIIGPVWLGKIQDNKFVKKVNKEQEKRGFKKRFLEEIDEPLYYDLHALGKLKKKKLPKIENVIEKLLKSGFETSRSNLCPTAVKTNAGIKNILKCL